MKQGQSSRMNVFCECVPAEFDVLTLRLHGEVSTSSIDGEMICMRIGTERSKGGAPPTGPERGGVLCFGLLKPHNDNERKRKIVLS